MITVAIQYDVHISNQYDDTHGLMNGLISLKV